MAKKDGTGSAQSRSRRRRARSAPRLLELFDLFIENVREYAIFLIDRQGRALSWNISGSIGGAGDVIVRFYATDTNGTGSDEITLDIAITPR